MSRAAASRSGTGGAEASRSAPGTGGQAGGAGVLGACAGGADRGANPANDWLEAGGTE
jgi:hypothetical protein